MKRTIKFWAFAVALALVATACSSGSNDTTTTTSVAGDTTTSSDGGSSEATTPPPDPSVEQVLRVGQVNDIAGIEPYRTSVQNWVFTSNVFDYMAEDTRGETGLQPHALADFRLADDNLSLTLTIRQGVTTHAGNPVTAEMVAYDFTDRMLVAENGGAYYSRIGPLVESIEVVDDITVVLHFSAPSPQVPGVLGTIAIADPVGFERSDGTTAAYNQSEILVSTGPFEFADYVPDQGFSMKRFGDYREAQGVTLERVDVSVYGDPSTMIAALEAGEIDYAFNVPTDDAVRLQSDDRFDVHIPSGVNLMYVTYLNPSRNEALRDVRIRQAIDLVSDRIGMNQAGFSGLGTPYEACYPENSIAFDPILENGGASNLEAAKAILEGVDLPTEPLVMPTPSTTPELLTLTQILAANLEAIGIPVAIETMDRAAWAERLNTVDFDIMVSVTGAVSEHPALQWDSRFFQPTGNPVLEGVTGPEIEAYQTNYAEGLLQSGAEATATWQAANNALKQGAWMQCLVAAPFVHITSKRVSGFTWNGIGMPIFRDVVITR